MGFNHFRVQIAVRTLLLSATLFLLFYLFFATSLTITLILVSVWAVVQVYSLYTYLDQTNRLLNNFLESIRYADFSKTFPVDERSDSSLSRLKNSFNRVIRDFQAVRAEKEEHFHYLQTILQHIGIALIAYRRNGDVEMINNASRKLFQLKNIQHINDLSAFSPLLTEKLMHIRHGENQLVRIQEKDDLLQLAVYATEFNIHNRSITLVSIKNIQQELDEKEMESWQKLIQVLTHEIMNSIAPISSLSATVSGIVSDLSEKIATDDDEVHESLHDVEQALQTIYKRADGLMHFVQTYRNLTKIPKPNVSIFQLSELFNNVLTLMAQDADNRQVKLTAHVEPPSLELSADEKLVEQVLINLVKNAIQALDGCPEPEVKLLASMNRRGRIVVQVVDNGQGIEPHVLEKIFIPFFSTKPQGSGIGLSLSRQILRLHGGTINVWSEPGKETRFTLTF